MPLRGIGETTATALVASVGNAHYAADRRPVHHNKGGEDARLNVQSPRFHQKALPFPLLSR